ncbi:hypothetical protein, partial [Brevundimonas sp.]|uniref:hypothetical protein n=1 Tax=Brevundimonas sp. TaxID=1871086 RepID=UPI00391B8279
LFPLAVRALRMTRWLENFARFREVYGSVRRVLPALGECWAPATAAAAAAAAALARIGALLPCAR